MIAATCSAFIWHVALRLQNLAFKFLCGVVQALKANLAHFWIDDSKLVTDDFKRTIRNVEVICSRVIRSPGKPKVDL